jgi:hypothetical protein
MNILWSFALFKIIFIAPVGFRGRVWPPDPGVPWHLTRLHPHQRYGRQQNPGHHRPFCTCTLHQDQVSFISDYSIMIRSVLPLSTPPGSGQFYLCPLHQDQVTFTSVYSTRIRSLLPLSTPPGSGHFYLCLLHLCLLNQLWYFLPQATPPGSGHFASVRSTRIRSVLPLSAPPGSGYFFTSVYSTRIRSVLISVYSNRIRPSIHLSTPPGSGHFTSVYPTRIRSVLPLSTPPGSGHCLPLSTPPGSDQFFISVYATRIPSTLPGSGHFMSTQPDWVIFTSVYSTRTFVHYTRIMSFYFWCLMCLFVFTVKFGKNFFWKLMEIFWHILDLYRSKSTVIDLVEIYLTWF